MDGLLTNKKNLFLLYEWLEIWVLRDALIYWVIEGKQNMSIHSCYQIICIFIHKKYNQLTSIASDGPISDSQLPSKTCLLTQISWKVDLKTAKWISSPFKQFNEPILWEQLDPLSFAKECLLLLCLAQLFFILAWLGLNHSFHHFSHN